MSSTRRATASYFLQISVFILLLAASLFISAGRAGWAMGWVFMAVVAASQISVALILMTKNPGLMGERAESKGKRDLDRVLAGVMALFGPVATCLVAGLNLRWGWRPQIPAAIQVAGVALALLGATLTAWAMAANRFFYGVLRVAPEQGHAVCDRGPYQAIRHPGYLGAILFDLAMPLILHSAWALIPAVLTVCAIVVRTSLEDKALQNGLSGYRDYAQRVRYRLLPAVW